MNIRKLIAADMPFGLHLQSENRWNQLEGDWRRQLDLEPDGSFVAERDGTPIGTACCCVFGEIAWINFVLVAKQERGQGVGTALMRHVMQYLEGRGVTTMRLDATPLGQPVYEKLGFVADFALTRFEGIMHAPSRAMPGVEPMTPADLPAVFRLDEAVTKTRREKLLRHLFEADPGSVRKYAPHGELEGYCVSRPGANAVHIGPIQGSPDAGRALLVDAAGRFAGQRVYVDVPTDHAAAVTEVQALGLTPQRPFLRMSRGTRISENLELFWSNFGPEKG